jgi:signal transduction histidine kinase
MNSEPRNSPSDDPPELPAYVRERFIEMFLSQSGRAQVGQAVVTSLFAWFWIDDLSDAVAIMWVAGALLVLWVRAVFTPRWVTISDTTQATRRIALVLFLNGLVMTGPLWDFIHFSAYEQAGITIALLGLSTGSIASTVGYRLVFLAYAIPLVGGAALAHLLDHGLGDQESSGTGLSILIITYLGFMTGMARQQYRIFEDACRHRFAESRLNQALQRALSAEHEASQAKTRFLAAASHDLRQPIHSMNVLVAALNLRPLDDRSRQIAQVLSQVNQTLSGQLDALLDVSKLDAGTIEPKWGVHRLDELLRSHFNQLQPVAESAGLRAELSIEGPVAVRTDSALLLRLISNLTDNAIKYNRPAGEIRLRLWMDAGEAHLAVSDTGIGIGEADRVRVFHEFYQVGNVERDRSKGLGLGLSIVERLTRLLQLRLKLESVVGQGTTLTLSLPIQALPEAALAIPDPTQASSNGRRVLVVDDEEQVRESMALLLGELGYEVLLADGTAQALQALETGPVDILLCDLRLREGDDGLLTIGAVQGLQPQVRAALITGETSPERLREIEACGVQVFHKPVALTDLRPFLERGQAAPMN